MISCQAGKQPALGRGAAVHRRSQANKRNRPYTNMEPADGLGGRGMTPSPQDSSTCVDASGGREIHVGRVLVDSHKRFTSHSCVFIFFFKKMASETTVQG